MRTERSRCEPYFLTGLVLSCIVLRASISFQSSRCRIRTIPAESRAKAFHASTSGAEAFLAPQTNWSAPYSLKARNQARKDQSRKENLGHLPVFPALEPELPNSESAPRAKFVLAENQWRTYPALDDALMLSWA